MPQTTRPIVPAPRRKSKAQRIAESQVRFLNENWHRMLGGNIAIAVKLSRGKHWIYTPVTPEAKAEALRAVRGTVAS